MVDSQSDSIREKVQTTDLPFAKERLDLRPHFLNRVEIRAVGRQIQQSYTSCIQNLPDSFYMVRTHIVHYNDITRTEGRQQYFFQLLDKTFPCCSALIGCKCFLTVKTNRGKYSRSLGRIQGCVIHGPLR